MKIIFEDQNLLIFDKPADLVVHDGQGDVGETLVDWLLENYPEIEKLDWPDPIRPGIVHRLDKDTSGLIILAKNPETLEYLQGQIRNHKVSKTYLTLVLGPVNPERGEIITKISRSNRDFRLKRSSAFSLDQSAKTAISNYEVLRNYNFMTYSLSLIAIRIITGRTHQIRSQMKYQGWPVIGDQQYDTKISRRISQKLDLNRQFLHAHRLEFYFSGKKMSFESELPEELNKIIKFLNSKS